MNPPPAKEPFFRLRELRKRLGANEVLRGLSLDFPAGKTTVVLGGSGAGKSVLLKHLNGLIHPDSGSIHVEGENITSMRERELFAVRKTIGILFQNGALFDSMSVAENVAFPLIEGHGMRRKDTSEKVARSLALVGLEGEGEKMPSALSGGMRKRAALARAMVTEPRCLLCDEPTAGLDPILSETISRLIRKTTSESGLTSVVVTHDLGAMQLMADHVVFLKGGRICFSGDLESLFGSTDPDVIEFVSATGGGG